MRNSAAPGKKIGSCMNRAASGVTVHSLGESIVCMHAGCVCVCVCVLMCVCVCVHVCVGVCVACVCV